MATIRKYRFKHKIGGLLVKNGRILEVTMRGYDADSGWPIYILYNKKAGFAFVAYAVEVDTTFLKFVR